MKIFAPNLVQTCEPGQTTDNNCKTAFSLRRLQLRVIYFIFYYFCTIFISVLLYTIKYDTIYSTCAQKRSKDKINEKINEKVKTCYIFISLHVLFYLHTLYFLYAFVTFNNDYYLFTYLFTY